MAFIPIPDTCQVEMIYYVGYDIAENTLYFARDGGWGVLEMTALGESLVEWWEESHKLLFPVQVSLSAVQLTDMSSQTGPVVTYTEGLPSGGTRAGTAAPNNVTLSFKFGTQLRGRSYRGRNYVPAIATADITLNSVNATLVMNIATSYNKLRDIAAANDASWVVASRYSGGQPRVTGVTTPITSASAVDNVVDSMRRRLPGRGQ